jgi:hypothetical protein
MCVTTASNPWTAQPRENFSTTNLHVHKQNAEQLSSILLRHLKNTILRELKQARFY